MILILLAAFLWISVCLQESLAQLEGSILYTQKLSWNDANQYCMSIGQNLLTIDSDMKRRIVSQEFFSGNYDKTVTEFWIGLHAPDPDNAGIHKWADTCSLPSYLYWSSHNTANIVGNLCTFVFAPTMRWLLDSCVNVTKPFICEGQRGVCNSGFYYQTLTAVRGDAPRGNIIEYSNVSQCENYCESEANTSFCWGFLYNIETPRCRLYNQIDDPFYNDVNQSPSSGYLNLHIRRFSYKFLLDSTPIVIQPVLNCGNKNKSCSLCNSNVQTALSVLFHTTFNDSVLLANTEQQTQEHTTKAPFTEVKSTASNFETRQKTVSTLTTITQDVSGTTDDIQAENVFLLTTIQQNVSGIPVYCKCTCPNITKILTFEESFQEILDHLKVDKSQTSSAIRKRTCAEDHRPTSAGIGYFGVFIIVSVFSVLMIFDCYVITDRLRLCY